jgi:hypothetical protein
VGIQPQGAGPSWNFDFGDVPLGETAYAVATFTNNGTIPLGFNGGYAFDPIKVVFNSCGEVGISPGFSCQVIYSFSPIDTAVVGVRQYPSVCPITNCVYFSYELYFRGRGVGGAPNVSTDIKSLEFGLTRSGTDAHRLIIVSNNGSEPIWLRARNISVLTAPFAVVGVGSCDELLPGGSCAVTVRFAPTTVGTFANILNLQFTDSVDSYSVALQVALSGVAN